MAQNNSLLNMAIADPASTDVHNNINDLIMKAEMDSKLRQYSMSAYKTPQPITGTVPDIALNPLLAAKKIPSLMKLLKKVNLRNPIYHHTNVPKAKKILESGRIKAMQEFSTPTKKSGNWANVKYKDKETGEIFYPPSNQAFSITRDPKFLSRPHSNIGTDVRFIMDRDDLIRKGYRIKPKAVSGFKKTPHYNVSSEDYKKIHGYYRNQMNPRFEFEERILGSLPTKDIKLIDIANFPSGAGSRFKSAELMEQLIKSNIPIIRSPQTTEQMINIEKMFNKYGYHSHTTANKNALDNLYKLLKTPTYKYNPFKLKNK